jgi:N-acetyl-1-D-myo-inositol-2-amino-2-deoxy-alpha-D-glucopyranoside deacetylase
MDGDRSSATSSAASTPTVLAVFAHPDDESLMCGGTLARLADAGVRVVLMCGSRGERGSVSDPSLVAGSDLGTVRVRELHEAAKVLGVAEVVALDHRDGDLRWNDVPEFHADIVDAIDRLHPDAVITFAENGLYWHLDHIAVHERTFTAVQSLGAAAPPLYFVTMPKGVIRNVVESAHATGGAPSDSSFWGLEPDAFGETEMPECLAVDVRPWIARKLAALRCHQTQMGPRNPIAWIGEDEARRLLGVEYFVRAPLESARPESLLEQLGDAVTSQ